MFARNTNTSIDGEENAGTVDLFRVVALYTIHDTRVAHCTVSEREYVITCYYRRYRMFHIVFHSSTISQHRSNAVEVEKYSAENVLRFLQIYYRGFIIFRLTNCVDKCTSQRGSNNSLDSLKGLRYLHRALIFSNVYRFLYFTSSSLRSAFCCSYHLGYSATNVSGNNEMFLTRFCILLLFDNYRIISLFFGHLYDID